MPRDHDRFRVELDVGARSERRPASSAPVAATSPDTPFCIALVGDFSGRTNRGIVEKGRALAARRPFRVDRDNVDEAIAQFAPKLELDLGTGRPVLVQFTALDDFHPDRLYERIPRFRSLHETGDLTAASPSTPHPPATAASPASGGSVLDQILGDAPLPPGGAALAAAPAEPEVMARDRSLEEYVRRAVTPHLVPNANPAREQIRAQAKATIESEMRALMHHPHFQALETLWRGVDFLVRRLETDERLRVYLVDVSKSELAADLAEATDPATSGMHRLLVESSIGTPGAMPWALVAGCFTFGGDEGDIELLGGLTSLGRAAGAPWISAAHPVLVGTPSFGDVPDIDDWSDEVPAEWASLRRSPDARYLGLALPRFLLRVPYGRKSDACESIQFEEVADPPKHEELLWGNPAIACALLLGEAFAESGWALRPRLDITGLPIHVVRTSTDVDALPCAEAVLSERAMAWMLERGIMPLLSMKGGDAIRLGRFQSIADPIASLAGRWSHDSDDGR